MDNSGVTNFIMAAIIVILLIVIYKMLVCETCEYCESFVGEPLGSGLENDVSDWGIGLKNRQERDRSNKVFHSMMNGYEDYNQVMMDLALDNSIYESHQAYVKDAVKLNLGPSNLSERSDDNDLIPWSYRRPDYHSVAPGSDARTTSSQYLDQMPIKNKLTI
jgi:hypothetical protein